MTVTLLSAVGAKARQISAVPCCVFVLCTNTQVRLAPATLLTVVVAAVPFPLEINASNNSFVAEVENDAVARVVDVVVPSATII